MTPVILRADAGSEHATAERCAILELSNTAHDAAASVARARVGPGVTTRWHRLTGIAERYVILEGMGSVDVGDVPSTVVMPGDVVLIPPDCRQRIANIGPTDLVFIAVCTPRFRQEAYVDVDPAPPD